MAKYIIKSVLIVALAVFVFLSAVFVFLEVQPGDVIDIYILDPHISPEAREALRNQLGLDRPLLPRYINYLRNFVTGNLGVSFSNYPKSVWDIIKDRLPRTLFLFSLALILSRLLGKFWNWLFSKRYIGVIARLRCVSIYATFIPWFALLIIWAFGYKLGWFPMGKFLDPMKWILLPKEYQGLLTNTVFIYLLGATGLSIAIMYLVWAVLRRVSKEFVKDSTISKVIPWVGVYFTWGLLGGVWRVIIRTTEIGPLAYDMLMHMVLPLATLTLVMSAAYALIMKSDMYGDPKALPFTPFFAYFLAFSIGAVVMVETVFSWRGMGWTLLHAILDEDMPLAVGTLLWIVASAVIVNLLANIFHKVGELRRSRTEAIPETVPEKPARRSKLLGLGLGIIIVFVFLGILHPILMNTV